MELFVQAWDELDDLVAVFRHVRLRYRRRRRAAGAASGRYFGISLQDAPYAKQL